MFQRELIIIFSLVTAIFLVVGGASWYAVRELHESSRMLVADTLPGLMSAGLAEECIHDNLQMMREMLSPHTASERAQLIEEVKTNSPDAFWHEYESSIFDKMDQQNYQKLVVVKSNYLQTVQQFLKLVTTSKIDEASALFSGELSARFEKYNEAAKKVFFYNVRQGIVRGSSVLKTTRYAPWMIGGMCILVFALGLALGLRSGLSGAK